MRQAHSVSARIRVPGPPADAARLPRVAPPALRPTVRAARMDRLDRLPEHSVNTRTMPSDAESPALTVGPDHVLQAVVAVRTGPIPVRRLHREAMPPEPVPIEVVPNPEPWGQTTSVIGSGFPPQHRLPSFQAILSRFESCYVGFTRGSEHGRAVLASEIRAPTRVVHMAVRIAVNFLAVDSCRGLNRQIRTRRQGRAPRAPRFRCACGPEPSASGSRS
jgi:hypothetical protein